jgi:hypothetical protein
MSFYQRLNNIKEMENKDYKEELRELFYKECGQWCGDPFDQVADFWLSKLETYADRRVEEMANAAEMLWVVLANVSESDWSKQTLEWQEAAKRWRDNYLNVRPSLNTKTPLEEDNK